MAHDVQVLAWKILMDEQKFHARGPVRDFSGWQSQVVGPWSLPEAAT
jgi:hypothetical protein